jgi:DNA processing protein
MNVTEELRYNIGITLIKGIGNSLAKNLIAYLGSASAVFHEKQQNLAKIPGIGDVLSREIVATDVLKRADEEIEFLIRNKINFNFYTDREYPFRLKECEDAPVMLYSKGSSNLNDGKMIAVVGTRNATDNGREYCRKFIEDISKILPSAIIISGLAYGIDICAHKAALDFGLSTFAVLGHGLDRIYPSIHRSTAIKILENGALITEYLSKTKPDRQNFVGRNRIIAGMSDVVVVIESALSGGALITAELASDYNRDVFAFPGRITDEWSAGCNALIKTNKAALIENASDLVKAMNWESFGDKASANIQTSLFIDLDQTELQIVTLLRQTNDGMQLNELSLKLELPVSKTSALLLQLEFKGIVKCLPGNIYRIVK